MSNILFKDILGVKDLESFEPVDNEKELEYVRGYGCETVEEFKSLYLDDEDLVEVAPPPTL